MNTAGDPVAADGFRVSAMYHPSLHVPDLAEAEEFFERVFGVPSVRLATMFGGAAPGRGVPDHSTFTLIGDVLIDSIDPRRYLVDGRQCYPDIETPRLASMGWYVDGVDALYRTLRERGVVLVDQRDEIADGDRPPTAVGSSMPLFFTVATDVGLRHELVPEFPFPLDPRTQPGWTLPPPGGPLGIVRCAHHTVMTGAPERALRLLVDAIGGELVGGAGRDDLPAAEVTSVRLGDAVIRLVPESVGFAETPLSGVPDRYHSITFEVVDLDRAESHLRAVGVALAARTATSIVADPDTAFGVPWEFGLGRVR